MGFYVELNQNPRLATEFIEDKVPTVFWTLFAVAGFALFCMGASAYMLLGKLFSTGSLLDLLLVSAILSALPIYLLIGIKLAGVRKFVSCGKETIEWGFRLFNKNLWSRKVARANVEGIELINHRPSPNFAVSMNPDSQYHVQGHWRIVLRVAGGKSYILDRNTDRDALLPLFATCSQDLRD